MSTAICDGPENDDAVFVVSMETSSGTSMYQTTIFPVELFMFNVPVLFPSACSNFFTINNKL